MSGTLSGGMSTVRFKPSGVSSNSHARTSAIGNPRTIGIKGERITPQSCRYAVAHVSPAEPAIGAGKNSCIRSCKDMLRIQWIDGYITIDQVLDSLLHPGCSHVGGFIHA